MSKRWRSNCSKIFKSPDNKRRKLIELDSKLINLDETQKRRKEVMAKSLLNFRDSDSDKNPNNYHKGELQKCSKNKCSHTWWVYRRWNISRMWLIWRKKSIMFNISILNIYKNDKFNDDNNIIKWESKYLFNNSGYCFDLRKWRSIISLKISSWPAIAEVCWEKKNRK